MIFIGCNYRCKDRLSCFDVTLRAQLNPTTNVDIICDGQQSCRSMEIDLVRIESFHITCLAEDACEGIEISLLGVKSSVIECWTVGACRDMLIKTNSWNTTKLIMKENSPGIEYRNSYGVNLDPSNGFVNLDCSSDNHFIQFNADSGATGREIRQSYNQGQRLPCDNIVVVCGRDINDTLTGECDMIYQVINNKPRLSEYNASCVWTDVDDLILYRCDGNCANSPTEAPTATPTDSPTIDTVSPSRSPTMAPINAPTDSPTPSPTPSPTESPTPAPTYEPSISPTNAPTDAPTIGPTRYPVVNRYFFGYILVNLILGNLTQFNILELYTHAVEMSQDMNVFLEESMLNAVNNGFRATLIYDNFDINIIKFNNVNINADNLMNTVPGLSQNILLSLNISCNREEQSISCLYILQTLRNDNAEFLSLSTDGISEYLDNTDAYVSVVEDELSGLTIDEYTPNTQVPFFEICVGIFAFVILVITLIAVLYDRNVCKRCSSRCYETDNAKVSAILKWAFQFYDFASDINFTIEIFFLMQLKREAYQDFNDGSLSDPNIDGDMLRTEALVSLVLGVGSFLFTIFPYGLNLYFNATIKNNSIIKNNSAAIQYFNSCPTLFVVLTVISGGIYPSLTVVSSKIFGLSMFNSGLTKYELNKLTKVKVISTVVCENLPQIVIQLVYMVVFGFAETNVRNAVILAFIGSILSVIISMLIWYINRTEFGTSPVIYYIELSKKHGMKLNMHERNN